MSIVLLEGISVCSILYCINLCLYCVRELELDFLFFFIFSKSLETFCALMEEVILGPAQISLLLRHLLLWMSDSKRTIMVITV